jgi:hypothetical protein
VSRSLQSVALAGLCLTLGCYGKPATSSGPLPSTQIAAPQSNESPPETGGGGGDPNARRDNMGRMMKEMQEKMKKSDAAPSEPAPSDVKKPEDQ